MRLEFTRIILQDFKEYRGKHALDLSSIGFGLHYIRGTNQVDALGSNGAGKSTLWDAFMWTICGRTVRGLRGIDVRTWGSKRQAVCRVDFYCDDKAHWIKRSTEKNGLWLDGKLVSESGDDAQRRMPQSTIYQSCLLIHVRQARYIPAKAASNLTTVPI